MNELAAEAARIDKDLSRILGQTSVEAETPLRLHVREVDSGGAPDFHPAFLRFLGNLTVCHCGRPAQCAPGCRSTRFDEHLPACEPACPTESARFHKSDHKSRPDRLKRALRQVRRLNPKAYDLLYLVLGLHWTYEAAMVKINDSNLRRGDPEHTEADFAVLWVSGASMLAASW